MVEQAGPAQYLGARRRGRRGRSVVRAVVDHDDAGEMAAHAANDRAHGACRPEGRNHRDDVLPHRRRRPGYDASAVPGALAPGRTESQSPTPTRT